MEKRVKVDKDGLARAQSNLKDIGHTIDEISSEIGSNFRNFRYKGHSMPIEAFQNLRELTEGNLKGSEIQYIDGKGERTNLNIEKSCTVAELTGIMLGDGYLQSSVKERENRITSAHRALITLHSDEKRLRDRVLDLLENLANKEPEIHRLKSSKAIQIIVNSKEFVRELQQIGLKAGDKVENQVEVPAWVTKDKKHEKCCLRGLVDTDGTIYRQSTDERVIIQFKNHSDPLLEGFRQMCADLDIEVSNAGKHAVQVAKQEDVKKFIEKVEPLKASNIDF